MGVFLAEARRLTRRVALGLFLIAYPLLLFAQQDSGFTNKAEAQNLMVNGEKEGKWLEYFKENGHYTSDTNARYYDLTIYRNGKIYGVTRHYSKNGKLVVETPFYNGKINGVVRNYDENGILEEETPYVNDKINGVVKHYGNDGKLITITNYVNSKQGISHAVDESGYEIDDFGNEIDPLNDTIGIKNFNWNDIHLYPGSKRKVNIIFCWEQGDPDGFDHPHYDCGDNKYVYDTIINFLKRNPHVKLEIGYHASPQGNPKHNLLLSQTYAQLIVAVLITKGIDSAQLVAKGYGSTEPIYSADYINRLKTKEEKEAAYLADRRVEVEIIE